MVVMNYFKISPKNNIQFYILNLYLYSHVNENNIMMHQKKK